MSRNVLALLIAGALILLSALEITYLNLKGGDPIKQGALSLDESRIKSTRSRAVVSVHGLPVQVPRGSLPARSVLSQSPIGEE